MPLKPQSGTPCWTIQERQLWISWTTQSGGASHKPTRHPWRRDSRRLLNLDFEGLNRFPWLKCFFSSNCVYAYTVSVYQNEVFILKKGGTRPSSFALFTLINLWQPHLFSSRRFSPRFSPLRSTVAQLRFTTLFKEMNSLWTFLLCQLTPLLFIALYCLQTNCAFNAVFEGKWQRHGDTKLLEGDLFLYQSS